MPKIHAYSEQERVWGHYAITSDLTAKVENEQLIVTVAVTQHNLHWIGKLAGAIADQVIPDSNGTVNGNGRSFPDYPLNTPLPLAFITVSSRV